MPSRQFDISRIDFDLLRREFARAKEKNPILKDLQDLIYDRLNKMLFNNPDRIKYHERYQAIIEDYNSQQDRVTIDNLIRDTLWSGLPECYDERSISGYRQRIYEYVYTRYKDAA